MIEEKSSKGCRGRAPAANEVMPYRATHPNASKHQASRDLGLDIKTVRRNWNYINCLQRAGIATSDFTFEDKNDPYVYFAYIDRGQMVVLPNASRKYHDAAFMNKVNALVEKGHVGFLCKASEVRNGIEFKTNFSLDSYNTMYKKRA